MVSLHEASIEAIKEIQAKLDKAVAALTEIAAQKLSTEMTPVDAHCANFDDGYDACIHIARKTMEGIS